MKHQKYLALFCLLVLTLQIVSCKKPVAAKKKKTRVVVASPKKMDFVRKINIRGNVGPKQFAQISARNDATIEFMPVDEGNYVKKNQILFRLEKLDWESKVRIEEYNLTLAQRFVKEMAVRMNINEAKLSKAKIDLQRNKKLQQQNLVSPESLESMELAWQIILRETHLSRAKLDSAKAKVAQAQNNLAIAKKYLQDCTVRAPFNGIVTRRYKEPGEYAKKSEPILRLENHEHLELSFQLSTRHYSYIQAKKTKAIVYSNNQEKFAATIDYKSPSVEANSRTFEIKIFCKGKKCFVSGMMCKADIILEKKTGLGVPKESVLIQQNNRYVVFVPQGNMARTIEVIPGITNNGYTELTNIKSPKSLQIIIEGQNFLSDKSLIQIASNQQEKSKP